MCVCVCVFLFSCVFDAVCMVLLPGFTDRPPLAAIYVCLFLFSCVFYAMCIFLIGLADRPADNPNRRSQQVISTIGFSR